MVYATSVGTTPHATIVEAKTYTQTAQANTHVTIAGTRKQSKIINKYMLSQIKVQTEFMGGSLQGYVNAKYSTLLKLFGIPDRECDGYKTDAEWSIVTPYGNASIYNYKDGKNYCGAEGTATTKITDWHIGSDDKKVVSFIQSVVEAYELNRK